MRHGAVSIVTLLITWAVNICIHQANKFEIASESLFSIAIDYRDHRIHANKGLCLNRGMLEQRPGVNMI